MMLNVIPPKRMLRLLILWRTKKYYNLASVTDIIEDHCQRYYVYIRRHSMRIQIQEASEDTISEIQNYLSFIFQNRYIGIRGENCNSIQLQGVRVFKL